MRIKIITNKTNKQKKIHKKYQKKALKFTDHKMKMRKILMIYLLFVKTYQNNWTNSIKKVTKQFKSSKIAYKILVNQNKLSNNICKKFKFFNNNFNK